MASSRCFNQALGRRLIPAWIAGAVLCLVATSTVHAADATDTPSATDATKPKLHRQAWPSSGPQNFEQRIQWMSRQLQLDATQQAHLRALLLEQDRQIRRLWASNPNPTADRVGPTIAIKNRTQDQIRAMLNDEQRTHYPAAIPREGLGPAQVDADHWIELSRHPAANPAPDSPH